MNRDVSLFELFKDLFGSVPTINGKPPPKSVSTHEGSSSKKKKKLSDASPKPTEDSDDDFMPDKHGNLPWKKNR